MLIPTCTAGKVPRAKKNSTRNKSARRKAQATGSGGAVSVSTGSPTPSRPWDSRREMPARGLVNLGNTCFLNSVLQNLFKTRPLHEALFGDAFGRREGEFIGPVNEVFRKTLLAMGDEEKTTGIRGAYSPKELLSAVQRVCPSFKGSCQQDAHELFMVLLGALEDEEVAYMKQRSRDNKGSGAGGQQRAAASVIDIIKAAREGDSPKETTTTALPTRAAVTDVFGSMVCSQVTCSTCAARSFATEPTICLSLSIGKKTRKKKDKLAAKVTKVAQVVGVAKAAETTKAVPGTILPGSTLSKKQSRNVPVKLDKAVPVKLDKAVHGAILPGSTLSKKQRRKLTRQERQHKRALNAESRAVAGSNYTRNGKRTLQRARRAHASCGRVADGDAQSCGIEPPSSLSNDGCISDQEGGLGRHVGDVAGGEEEMAGAMRSSIEGDATKWCLPGSHDGCAVDEADGAVGIPEVGKTFLEWNDDGDVDDDPRTDTPGSTVSSSSWNLDAFMFPVSAGPGTRTPSPSSGKHAGEKGWGDGVTVPVASDAEDSVEVSDGMTTGDEDDTDTSSSAIAKSPLNRLVEPQSRIKKTEEFEPLADNLYDCLDRFVAEEALIAANGNGYNCEACSARTMSRSHKVGKGRVEVDGDRKKQDARKRLLLLGKPPSVLVCHLKRLQATKIARKVTFDLEMDMSPYFWQDPQAPHTPMETRYRLSGIVQHEGSHLGGHYVAYTRDIDGWKYASDNMIRKATLQEVMDCEAYMLFYERCDLDHPAK